MYLLLIKAFLGRILDALKWCAERPAIAVAVVSLVIAAFYYIKADHLTEKLENARSQIVQLTNERKEAIRYANAEKKRIEAERKAITDEADKKLRIALADADARLRQYAKTHSAKAHLSGPASVAGEPQDATGDALVVSYRDAAICSANSVKLMNAYTWARETYSIKLDY